MTSPDKVGIEQEQQEQHLKTSFLNDLPSRRPEEYILPQWMEDYFSWHNNETSSLTRENWNQKNFLVLRCLDTDGPCGGLADRCT